MKTLHRAIEAINVTVGQVAGWLLVPMTLVTVYDVIARRFFNAPTSWAPELTWFLFAALWLLGMGYTELQKGHVAIDVFSSRFGPGARLILGIMCYVCLFGVFMVILFREGLYLALASWKDWEHTNSSWAPPLYPVKTLLPIGVLLLLLQGLSNLVRNIEDLLNRGNEHHERLKG